MLTDSVPPRSEPPALPVAVFMKSRLSRKLSITLPNAFCSSGERTWENDQSRGLWRSAKPECSNVRM